MEIVRVHLKQGYKLQKLIFEGEITVEESRLVFHQSQLEPLDISLWSVSFYKEMEEQLIELKNNQASPFIETSYII